jgi:hypothetical protein
MASVRSEMDIRENYDIDISFTSKFFYHPGFIFNLKITLENGPPFKNMLTVCYFAGL